MGDGGGASRRPNEHLLLQRSNRRHPEEAECVLLLQLQLQHQQQQLRQLHQRILPLPLPKLVPPQTPWHEARGSSGGGEKRQQQLLLLLLRNRLQLRFPTGPTATGPLGSAGTKRRQQMLQQAQA